MEAAMGVRSRISSLATRMGATASLLSLGPCIAGGKLAEETRAPAADAGMLRSPPSVAPPPVTPPPSVGATGGDDVDASLAVETNSGDAASGISPVSCAPTGT